MARALTTLSAVCLLILTGGAHSWLDGVGFDSKCRAMSKTEGDKGVVSVDSSCTKGTVEWHYPSFDRDGLEITWSISGSSKICILPSSMIGYLSNVVTSTDGQKMNLGSLSARDVPEPKPVCVDVNDGKFTLQFMSGDMATYVAVIDYSVE